MPPSVRSIWEIRVKAIHAVSAAVDKKGIFAIDIGGNRRKIIIPLIDKGLRFVIRQNGERHILLPSGKRCPVRRAAQWCRTTSERFIEVEREGYRGKKHLRLGVLSVRLPERPQVSLWLVVVRGLAPPPILLLTNVPPSQEGAHAAWIADVYLTRWKCEEFDFQESLRKSETVLRSRHVLSICRCRWHSPPALRVAHRPANAAPA